MKISVNNETSSSLAIKACLVILPKSTSDKKEEKDLCHFAFIKSLYVQYIDEVNSIFMVRAFLQAQGIFDCKNLKYDDSPPIIKA